MRIHNATLLLLTGLLLIGPVALSSDAPASSASAEYTAAGQIRFPAQYREWVYLSSGFDMSYNPAMQMAHHVFDNVFVSPDAYRAFATSGHWPEGTMLMLESREAQ